MPAKNARQTPEPVPLFTKLETLKMRHGIVVARSRSGKFVREGNMTVPLFMRLAIMGLTMLSRHGVLPTFTVLGKLEKVDDDRVLFSLGFAGDPELCIEAHVSVGVAEDGRDRLNAMLPVNVRHIRVASGRL